MTNYGENYLKKMSTLEDRLKHWYQGDDKLLYHYTSLSSACKILENHNLRLSNLTNTNDPLEFAFTNSLDCSWVGEIDEKKVFRELEISRMKRASSVRMMCFCMDKYCKQEDWNNEKNQNYADNFLFKGWARSRMWAQYAENHAGVCLIFDKEKFKDEFEGLKEKSDAIEILQDQDITYSNYLTNLEAAMVDIRSGHTPDKDYTDFYLEPERRQYLFQKCEDYRDENEYRFCLINRDLKSPDEPMFVDYGSSLLAIIYGQRFSKALQLRIPDSVEQYQIFWKYGKPDVWKV